MPNWNDMLNEVKSAGSIHDVMRRKYLKALYDYTGRNVIVYYSGWLQKSSLVRRVGGFSLSDEDKTGFMSSIHGLDRDRGLDIILHTPGGDMSATESLVDYLRSMFGTNIRAIVPQLAMSAGTMIACACESIVMGKHSSLGPIDPQCNGIATHGVIEEFTRAAEEIAANPQVAIPLWQPIIAKYNPTLVGECEKAIKWSNEIVHTWLVTGMFRGEQDAITKANKVISELGDHALTLSHNRHISADKASEIGLHVEELESDSSLQEAVLSVHHACMQTIDATSAIKIIENHKGMAYIKHVTMEVNLG